MTPPPWYTYPFLLFPDRILANLENRVRNHLTVTPPNAWQLSLGVMRMWHRSLFRSESVGTSPSGQVRQNWRAKLLYYRGLRLPFLLREAAIAPLDLTGLASSPERIIKHLLGAHHDGNQFIYDLELLSAHKGALESLASQAAQVAKGNTKRSRWLQDLSVFKGYHHELLAATQAAILGIELSESDNRNADISLNAYLRWCFEQPSTPAATLQAIFQGSFSFRSDPDSSLPDLKSAPL